MLFLVLISAFAIVVIPNASALAQQQVSVVVGDVIVEGGFDELANLEELLVAPFRGRRATVEELEALALTLERLYQEFGYFLVRVTIPPQEVHDGETLRLLVLDGYLEAADLTGVPGRLRPRIDALLEPVVGKHRLTMDEFERVVSIGRQLPGVTLRTTLVPGEAVGASSLVVESDWRKFSGSVSASSRLTSASAPWNTSLQLRLNQLLGRGEQVSLHLSGPSSSVLSFSNSLESTRTVGGNVQWPLGNDGTTLTVGYTYSQTFMPPPIFIIPPMRSVFHNLSMQVGEWKRLTRSGELRVSTSLDATEQYLEVLGFDALVYRDVLRVFRVDINSRRDTSTGVRQTWAVQLSQGIAWGARTKEEALASGVGFSRPEAVPTFQKANVTASWRRPFASGAALTSTLRAQYAFFGPLPTTELFSTSGSNALPGLALNMPSGDVGWTLREELEKPFRFMNGRLQLSVYGYAAAGSAAPEARQLAGVAVAGGVGMRADAGPVRLSLEYTRGRFNTLSDESVIGRLEVSF